MKTEYDTICAEAEETLHASGVRLPLAWMVGFILDYAETGIIDPDDLQDMAEQIRLILEDRITRD